jgi:hypothetical protein
MPLEKHVAVDDCHGIVRIMHITPWAALSFMSRKGLGCNAEPMGQMAILDAFC